MSEVSFLPGAKEDYRAGYAWYFENGEHIADSFETAVDDALRVIGEAPYRGARYDDRHHCYLLRRFPYSIIYRIERDAVVVVAVAHGKRNPDYWRKRET